MTTTGIVTLEIVEQFATKGTETYNNSQVKGESYSIFRHFPNGEYELLHNRNKETDELKQIIVFGTLEDDTIIATSCPKLKEIQVIFDKETLQEIVWKLNDKFSNDKLDTKRIIMDFDIDNNKMIEIRLDKRPVVKLEISNQDNNKINNNNKKEQKMETADNGTNNSKKLKDFHGVMLTEKEKSVYLTILKVMNGNWEDPIYSKAVTDGSLSVSGTISMLNRKGLVNCEKQKINGGRKLPTVSLTILAKSFADLAQMEIPTSSTIEEVFQEGIKGEDDIEAALGLKEYEEETKVQDQDFSAVEEVDDDIR